MSGGYGAAACRDEGFTLAEVLIAAVLSALVMGSAIALFLSQETMAETPAAAIDAQQRARLGISVLRASLALAGAGPASGPLAGPLNLRIPPVVPRRLGASAPDDVLTVRDDAVSLLWVASTASATTLEGPIAGVSPLAAIADLRTCPSGQPACGIAAGATVLVVEPSGRFALYLVAGLSGAALALQALQTPAPALAAGAVVVPVEVRTYYLDTARRQLRVYDGHASDTPVVDDVVGMHVTYLGDPVPEVRPRPPLGTANCLVDEDGNTLTARSVLPAAGGSLAYLSADTFRDGPWCGDGAWTYDVDLLRIRTVRVSLRVQTSVDGFRLSGAGYLVSGTSHRAAAVVPDLVLSTFVTPRNLNAGR
jgi:hypothetical protein